MRTVKHDDHVTVIYEGTLKTGEIFETSGDTGPLSFTVGQNNVMPAFEQAVLGMGIGESKSITIMPEEAFGARNAELVVQLPKKAAGEVSEPKSGMILGIDIEKDGQNHKVPALVTAVVGDMITVDLNHPLAGQELIYTITVNEIADQQASQADNNPSDSKCSSSSGCGCGCN